MLRLGKKASTAIKGYRDYKNSILTKNTKPNKKLTHNLKRNHGRNHTGAITVRHKIGGAKKLYREISFVRKILNQNGVVETIEYDPNRNSFISLIKYPDGKVEYIIHPEGLKKGDIVCASNGPVEEKPGNCTLLKHIAERTFIHCIELYPGRGATLARAAGTYGEVLGQSDAVYTIVKLSSGSILKIVNTCAATIGVVSNKLFNSKPLYKAGQSVKLGKRPSTRGVAMNPIDHPHGGGEGKTGTKRHPVSYSGKLTKGKKTADKNRPRARFILKERKVNKK